MKKWWTLLLVTAMVSALTLPACADVLWEPENSFYERHREDCDYLGRAYMVNSPEGFVTAWNAPDGSVVEGQFPNGTRLFIYWVYENWGVFARKTEGDYIEGWVDMENMVLLYDHIAFAEDYADQIMPYNGEFADYDGKDQQFNFYEYPGAPEICHWMTATTQLVPELTGIYGDSSAIQSIFVDEQGLTWGYIGYHYGRVNAWFCLDDPDGVNDENQTDFPLREITYENIHEAKEPVLPGKAYLPYALVGGVVIVTAAALVVFFKKKKG